LNCKSKVEPLPKTFSEEVNMNKTNEIPVKDDDRSDLNVFARMMNKISMLATSVVLRRTVLSHVHNRVTLLDINFKECCMMMMMIKQIQIISVCDKENQ
jgi:hypothetical protein